MKRFELLQRLIRAATILTAVILTVMMARAMKLLYTLMRNEGLF